MIKADLERHLNKVAFAHSNDGAYRESYEEGFTAALELLWPCVESVERIATSPLPHRGFTSDFDANGVRALCVGALARLEGKLKLE
jgi:hypothetical protein